MKVNLPASRRTRHLTWSSAVVSLMAIASLASHAQSNATRPAPSTPLRTASGDKDFEGVWNYGTMTPLERPREFADKNVLTEEEAADYERKTLERETTANNTAGPDWWDPGTRHLASRRTSLIVDPLNGRLPPLTPEAQKRAAALAEARRARGPADSVQDLGLHVRCLVWETAGPPMLPGIYNNNVQFFQTRQYIAMFNEMIHDVRIVPMDGRPHGATPQWMGDSRGHWEGRTLVVDTINFTDKTSVRGSDEHLHLVERFTRVDPDTIEYRFTVDDPTVWTRSWTAAVPMHRSHEPIYEYACHEGNARSMVGILSTARAEDDKPPK